VIVLREKKESNIMTCIGSFKRKTRIKHHELCRHFLIFQVKSCARGDTMEEIKECSTTFNYFFLSGVAGFERRGGIFKVIKHLTFAM
jgi:hypothetical protein